MEKKPAMKKQCALLHCAADYLPFVAMLLPTTLLAAAAAISVAWSEPRAEPRVNASALEVAHCPIPAMATPGATAQTTPGVIWRLPAKGPWAS